MSADAAGLLLGRTTGDSPEPVRLDPADLTTHGVVVGMTGSGKTGLLVGLLEECLLAGVPAVVVDPKGDLANIFLTFPDLRPEDFRPWVDAEEARREGISVEELAAKTAAKWRKGLQSDGQDLSRIHDLRRRTRMRLYTPGSDAGLPVNVLSGFDPPRLSWERDAEVLRERIAGAVSALLERAGEEADPLMSPAHIFLANLLEDRWRAGERPDLASLLGYLVHPPFEKLGVLHVDTFYPPQQRRRTVQKLNALLASPAFASWQQGTPLDLDTLLAAPAGKTPLALFYTAHLGDEDRQMFATLLLGEIATWMRGQSGTGSLRLLVLMDEVWGLMPPHPADPPTKKPMLTLLKQARAFGVGLAMATQNPVDLDYKGLTNAGVWGIGRLSTERDKDRLLDGLDLVAGGDTRRESDAVISSLKPRQFLLRNVHEKKRGPRVFSTRWVFSYLRGPLTREEVRTLAGAAPAEETPDAAPAPGGRARESAAAPAPAPAAPAATPLASLASPPDGVPVYYLEPRAVRPDRAGGAVAAVRPGPPRRYRPALLGRATVRFDERRAGLDHVQEEWRLIFPLEGSGGWRWPEGDAPEVGEDLGSEPVPGVPLDALPPALEEKKTFRELERELKSILLASEKIEILSCPGLKQYSRVGETEEAFRDRMRGLAEEAADEKIADLREKYLRRERRLRDRVEREAIDVERARSEASSRRAETWISLGETVLGSILGGRRSSRTVSGTARRRRMTKSAESRVRKEEAQLQSAEEELQALEDELQREIEEIREDAEDLLCTMEKFPVTLERDDVKVDEVAVLWIPDGA